MMADSLTDEYFDLYQEIARSAFADMLHDHERNQKYCQALKKAIDKMHERNLPAHVLDIGTGTAILSMMAVASGADSVTACEAFRPMADCAEKIIESNGMSDAIRIIKKRSTELRVGSEPDDLVQRANILVTEVFDTELIGEGAIETFNHAHLHLLEKDCYVVPDSATMYVQTVESPLAWAWNSPKLVANLDGDVLLRTPTDILECKGSCELNDIQLNQLPTSQFREIIEPTAVFEFDWSGKKVIPKNEFKTISVEAKLNGTAQVFFMWWILKMDQEGEIRISCAPHWAHEDFDRLREENPEFHPIQNLIPWRDHWMQAIYYAPKAILALAGEQFELQCFRDEFSLWFDLKQSPSSSFDEENTDEKKMTLQNRPFCTCGFHLAYSRTRIGQLNNNLRMKTFLKIIDATVDEQSTVLFISEGSLIGLAIAALNTKHVYYLDSNRYSRRVVNKYIEFNQLTNISLLESIDDVASNAIDLSEVSHIIGEPNFCTSVLPWDNFYFGELVSKIIDQCPENVTILPNAATIRAVPVEFLDLHKIFAPFGMCELFDLSIFDRVIEKSSEFTDAIVEAQPLWEYPNKALGPAKTVFSVDFRKMPASVDTNTDLTIETAGTCNGIAFWTEYKFSDLIAAVSTGPLNDFNPGDFIKWDMHTRQGVHLLWKPIKSTASGEVTIPCGVRVCDNGTFRFSFT